MYVTVEWNDTTHAAELRTHEGAPTLDQLQAAVGGYIGTAGRVRSGAHRTLDVWCNDEGFLDPALQPVAYLGATLRTDAPYTIRGGLVITASDTRTGDTVPMTAAEVERVRLGDAPFLFDFAAGRMLPNLNVLESAA